MSPTNNTKVIIGGNVYTLSGEESEEYIQRVALYINNKLDALKKSDNAKVLNTRLMSVLLEINMADDYFKAKELIETLNRNIEEQQNQQKTLEDKINELNVKLEQSLEEKNNLHDELKMCKKELDDYIEMFDQESRNF